MMDIYRVFAEAEVTGGVIRALCEARGRLDFTHHPPRDYIQRPQWIRAEFGPIHYGCAQLSDLHLVAEQQRLNLLSEIERRPLQFAELVNAVNYYGLGHVLGSKLFGPQRVAHFYGRLGLKPSSIEPAVEKGELLFYSEAVVDYRGHDRVVQLLRARTAIESFSTVTTTLDERVESIG